MPTDILNDAEAQAPAAIERRPAMTEGLIALAAQAALALPLAALLGPFHAMVAAGIAATFFLLGYQASQAMPLWRAGRLRVTWTAARRASYPAIATSAAALLAAILTGGG